MELRPLGFGEIFDRAVTLYIRNFVPFAAIVAVLIVPLAILQFVLNLSSQPEFDAMVRAFQHPGQASTERIPTIFDSPVAVGVLAVTLLLAYVMGPFAMNAVAVGVARVYRSRPVEFRACYEAVLNRWPQILGMIGIEFLVVLGLYITVVFVAVGIIFVAAALGAALPAMALVFGVTAVLVVVVVMLPLLAPLIVALAFAMYAAVIEERPVFASLLLGFSRVFNRAEFWRALLFSIAALAITLGASTMFSMFGLLAAFVHLPVVETVIQTVPSFVITPFSAVLLAIYYFDVRIRHEAFDLEASLDRLTAAQPA
jgi:hypothetical protein